LGALRKISAAGPPKGTLIGERPLKVTVPPATMVTEPWAMRALSTLEKTKIVTIPAALTGAVVEAGAAVGTLAGAVYLPVASTEPQSLPVGAVQLTLSILAVVSKVTPQVTWSLPRELPLRSWALNCLVSPTARVAVVG